MGNAVRTGALPAVLGLAGLLLAAPAAAADPPIQVNPNRPTFATPALTTQDGVAELEFGLQHAVLPEGDGHLSFTPFLLKLGLLKPLELRIGGNGVLRGAGTAAGVGEGFGDLTVGAQWTYLPGGPLGIDQAVQVTFKLPTASVDKGLGSGQVDRTLMLIFSRDFGPYHADANALVTWLGLAPVLGGGTDLQPAGTLSVSRTLSPAWSLTGELYGIGATAHTPHVVSNLWALGYKVSSRLVLDAGFDKGLIRGAPRISLFAGFTTGLGRFRPAPLTAGE